MLTPSFAQWQSLAHFRNCISDVQTWQRISKLATSRSWTLSTELFNRSRRPSKTSTKNLSTVKLTNCEDLTMVSKELSPFSTLCQELMATCALRTTKSSDVLLNPRVTQTLSTPRKTSDLFFQQEERLWLQRLPFSKTLLTKLRVSIVALQDKSNKSSRMLPTSLVMLLREIQKLQRMCITLK